GLEEGLFPLNRTTSEPLELEEERRLFYVGATRAKSKLYLSSARVRYRFGEVESIPSRFIKEIPDELIDLVDKRSQLRFGVDVKSHGYFASKKRLSQGNDTPVGVHYDFEESEIMRTGRLVQHPTFGRGKIVKAEGYGESLVLNIMFSGFGLKKIMAKYAKLKIIG
ncbi:MAG: hypothetical protein GXO93_00545, partial [FCB group bacterium]|nr:hypothetical protein [FCB group bacterium]